MDTYRRLKWNYQNCLLAAVGNYSPWFCILKNPTKYTHTKITTVLDHCFKSYRKKWLLAAYQSLSPCRQCWLRLEKCHWGPSSPVAFWTMSQLSHSPQQFPWLVGRSSHWYFTIHAQSYQRNHQFYVQSLFVVPTCCRDACGDKRDAKIILWEILSLCSKGILI